MPVFDFPEWLPDQPDLNNPGVLKAVNVIPKTRSYGPLKSFEARSTNAISGTAQGAISVKDNTGLAFTYVGDGTKLYELGSARTFVDESKAGGYTAAADPAWEFAEFDTLLCATNLTDPVQSITIGAGASSAFADLITSTLKPKAKTLAVIRNFLVLGNTVDAVSGEKNNRVWWCGFDDPTDFDPDAATQSSFRNLPFGGTVQKIVGGVEYGVVFQDNAIRRMTYVGSPAVFRIDAVDRKRGTQFPKGICGHGRNIFYPSEEGFFVFDGTTSHPIGDGKVDDTFNREFDPSHRARLSCSIDLENKLYQVAFPGDGSTGGNPNKIWSYYWPRGKWSEAEIDSDMIFTSFIPPTNLDALTGNLDTDFTISFDSAVYKGGRPIIAGIDTSGNYALFDGSNMKATFGLSEARMIDGKRSFLENLRPLIDGETTAITGRLGRREQQNEAATFTSTVSMNDIGEIPFLSTARYHRAEIFIAAGETWSHAIGIDIPPDAVRPVGRN